MSRSELWRETKYLAPYNYILDTNIVEFDIAKANINVLRRAGAINELTYQELYDMPKRKREITVGRMLRRDPAMSPILKEGITEARHELFDKLGLQSQDVLAINNDAVFIIFNQPTILSDVQVNDYITFKMKGCYRSFYYLKKKQFFYTFDPISGMEGMDIKGIGEYGIKNSQGFINLLSDIFYTTLANGVQPAYDQAVGIYNKYISKTYPLDFYRRLDSYAQFEFYKISEYCSFRADTLSPASIGAVNPAYNAGVLLELIAYFTESIIGNR